MGDATHLQSDKEFATMKTALITSQPRSRVTGALLAAVLTFLSAATMDGAAAHDYQLGALKIVHPWTRATPGGARVAGGFMKITNTGKVPDKLIGGTLVAAGSVEIHETRMDGDVMRMRRLEQGLVIAPGQTVELRPGSYHIMFMQLTGSFKEGERVGGTLVFEKAGTINVDFKIEAIGTKGGGNHH